MEPQPLSLERCSSSLFKRPWVVMLKDGLIEGDRQSSGEHVDSLWTVDVVLGMSHKLFELGNIFIKVLSLHFDSLA